VETDGTSVLMKALFYIFLSSLLGLAEALDIVLVLTVSRTVAKMEPVIFFHYLIILTCNCILYMCVCVCVYINVCVCIYVKFDFDSFVLCLYSSYLIVISSKMTTVMYCICHHVAIKGDIAFLICCKKWIRNNDSVQYTVKQCYSISHNKFALS